MQVGPVLQGSNGAAVVSHLELRSWASNVGLILQGTDAEWLNKMSACYAQEIHRSEDKDTTAPYVSKD